MKRLARRIMPLLLLIGTACTMGGIGEDERDAFLSRGYGEALLVLNGEAETFSAYAPSDGRVYRNIKLVGSDGSSEAWPNDIYSWGGYLFVVCSGQNSVEKYDGRTLDYLGRVYLKNGFNPMVLCPVGNGSIAAVAGYADDQIVLIDLDRMEVCSGFLSVYGELNYQIDNSESVTDPTVMNGTGDNKSRHPEGLASYGSYLYAGNVRYDSSIYLSDTNGEIITYEGAKVKASGYFREGTLSIFAMDSDYGGATLMGELNLQDVFESLGGEAYFPGDGLNPQSLFVLGNKLHIVCSGRNGGDTLYYGSAMYIPSVADMGVGYSTGDPIPGTDADDGVILIMDLSDPEHPAGDKILPIGGSPVGFRYSRDEAEQVLYLAGVGSLLSYSYVQGAEAVLRGSGDPIVEADDTTSGYFTHILFREGRLYLSDYTHDRLDILGIGGTGGSYTYTLEKELTIGDGPGASVFVTY